MRIAVWISIGAATGALALGYALNGTWPGAVLILFGGLAAGIAQPRSRVWSASAGLFLVTAAAAYGVWSGAAAMLMLAGIVAALAAWDLAYFERRIRHARRAADRRALIRSHVWRLSIALGAGFVLGWFSLGARIELDFGWLLLLGLIALLGLSAAIGFQRREPTGE